MSQPRLNDYLSVAKVPQGVREIIRNLINLKLDHLVQICRLKTPEEQIELAKKADEEGWTVKKLKAAVDKSVKPKKAPHQKIQSGNVSFMARFWPGLMANTKIDACGYWAVEYKSDGWHFVASDTKFCAPEDFAGWFRQLADALDSKPVTTAPAPAPAPASAMPPQPPPQPPAAAAPAPKTPPSQPKPKENPLLEGLDPETRALVEAELAKGPLI
jgi:hypothetical protein